MAFLNGTDPGLRQTRTPTVDTFAAGVGFTAGSSTQVTLTADPGSENSLIVTFDGITQHRDTYSVSGTTVTFDAAIATGVSKVEATYTTTIPANTPADASVTTIKIADGAITSAKLASDLGVLTRDEHGKAVRAMMLEMADIKGAAIGFPEGNADAFDTDTLTATSTNALYDATNDYYTTAANITLLNTESNAAAASAYSFGLGGPWAGNYSTYAANQVDGDTSTGYHSASQGTSDSWQVTLSSGGTATMLRSGSANGGAHASGGVSVYTNIVLYGSNDGSSWTTLHTVASDERAAVAGAFIDWDFANTTSYTHYKTDWSWGSSYYHQGPIQWAWYSGDGTNLNGTFVSPAYTATAAPTKGYITVQAQLVSATINTDLSAEISRDGGSTWTAVTLATGSTQSSFTLYEGGVDISSQPSGTSMKYRVKTLNGKTIYISGVVLRWS